MAVERKGGGGKRIGILKHIAKSWLRGYVLHSTRPPVNVKSSCINSQLFYIALSHRMYRSCADVLVRFFDLCSASPWHRLAEQLLRSHAQIRRVLALLQRSRLRPEKKHLLPWNPTISRWLHSLLRRIEIQSKLPSLLSWQGSPPQDLWHIFPLLRVLHLQLQDPLLLQRCRQIQILRLVQSLLWYRNLQQ